MSVANAAGGMGKSLARGTTYDTEARPGFMSTEFWVGAISSLAVLIAGYASEDLSVERGWTLFSFISIGYLVSRGLAKAGSKDSFPVPDVNRMGGGENK